MRSSNRKLASLIAAATVVATGAAAQSGRTVYEIEVFGAGTKSQGLRGILYDIDGRRLDEGPPVQTPVGSFHWLPCRMLWESCGRWRAGPTPTRSSYPRQNRTVLRYRITREDRGGRSRWRGELVGLGPGTERTRPVETAMGTFRWTSGTLGAAQWRGWVPQGWPDLPLVSPREQGGD